MWSLLTPLQVKVQKSSLLLLVDIKTSVNRSMTVYFLCSLQRSTTPLIVSSSGCTGRIKSVSRLVNVTIFTRKRKRTAVTLMTKFVRIGRQLYGMSDI